MSQTTDPKDPALGHGADDKPVPMNEKYLVLSDAELAKGYIRPFRDKYIHVGVGGSEVDPNDPSKHGRTGLGCGTETVMGEKLSATYARDPKFYGSTYCCGCSMHRPVAEFVWSADGARVGS